MEYKGFKALIEFDADNEVFVGTVLGVKGLHFDGVTVKELETKFKKCVDTHLENNPNNKPITEKELTELKIYINDFVEHAVTREYAPQILDMVDEESGKTFMDSVVEDVLENSSWDEDRSYSSTDIRYAIGREFIARLGILI